MAVNVLFASSYTGLGGGETWLLTLTAQLDPARYRPHLLVPRDGALAQRWREHGWQAHILPYRGATTYFVPSIWARLPTTGAIADLLHQHEIAAVHSDYHTLPFVFAAARRTGIPAFWTCMGWWFRPKIWQRGFFTGSPVTFAHSEAIKAGFLGRPPFMTPERVEVLYPGVDMARFSPQVSGVKVRFDAGIPQDAPVVAMVARFQAVKGHDVFQDVALQVAAQIPNVYFIVAGENTQSGADNAYKQRILERASKEYPLRTRLKYLGFRADVERVLAAADVVVCPSRFESYGVVNVEAMASGKPVVSTNRGGPSETIRDGETGYLVTPEDVAGYARAVITLLRDPLLREDMGAAGRARVEAHFSAQSNGVQFTQALEHVLGAAQVRRA